MRHNIGIAIAWNHGALFREISGINGPLMGI
jgi:hypothetical protein